MPRPKLDKDFERMLRYKAKYTTRVTHREYGWQGKVVSYMPYGPNNTDEPDPHYSVQWDGTPESDGYYPEADLSGADKTGTGDNSRIYYSNDRAWAEAHKLKNAMYPSKYRKPS